jgi:preprotein translocase subunit SecE
VARSNRKRARTRGSGAGRSGLNGVNGNGAGNGADPDPLNPLEHASPDAELAEAQLAFGRPELADIPSEDELEEAEEATEPAAGVLSIRRSQEVAEHRQGLLTRMVGFLRGSWRELQRVQWPDRRQVMQATGVVIGFVIVAGAFLGVASFAAQKIVNLILYGHG